MKTKISRRKFLKNSLKSTAFMGITGSFPRFQQKSRIQEYDLLISGGMVYDGQGIAGRKIDIAIKKDKIHVLSKNINPKLARRVIKADGLTVAPGFIDAHSHTGVELLANPKAESQVRQGVTTEISGNCGSSNFPIADSVFEDKKKKYREEYHIDLNWRDIQGFFSSLAKRGMAINYATLLGHGNVRGEVVGYYDKQPDEDQMIQMKKIVEENLKAGALGLSTGLIYPPGSYAKTREIVELCQVVSSLKGVYATHMRNENDHIIEAINETLEIARKTRVSLQISHLKVGYPRNWPKIKKVLKMLDQAHVEGINILADRYPYIAGANDLSDSLFPLWALQGTTEDFLKILKNADLEAKLRAHQKKELLKIGSWEKIVISDVFTDKNKFFEGKNILEASQGTGKDAYEFIRDLLIEEKNRVGKIAFYGNEDNLKKILSHPRVVVGADGSAVAPYGILNKGKPHPRLYGTFPRMLGKYVREEKIFSLSKAIQKMTSMTAKKFGLTKRGQIQEGFFADLVIFDPDKVKDLATWKKPQQYPEGIEVVIVNGQPVIYQGEHTGNLPGTILKKGGDR